MKKVKGNGLVGMDVHRLSRDPAAEAMTERKGPAEKLSGRNQKKEVLGRTGFQRRPRKMGWIWLEELGSGGRNQLAIREWGPE